MIKMFLLFSSLLYLNSWGQDTLGFYILEKDSAFNISSDFNHNFKTKSLLDIEESHHQKYSIVQSNNNFCLSIGASGTFKFDFSRTQLSSVDEKFWLVIKLRSKNCDSVELKINKYCKKSPEKRLNYFFDCKKFIDSQIQFNCGLILDSLCDKIEIIFTKPKGEIVIERFELFRYDENFKNLIPNGSFEFYYSLPHKTFTGYNIIADWNYFDEIHCFDNRTDTFNRKSFSIGMGSPDLGWQYIENDEFNYSTSFFGKFCPYSHQENKNKSAIGEYFQVKLTEPLIEGKVYKIQGKIKMDVKSGYSVNSIGIRLGQCIFTKDEMYFDGSYPEATIYISDGILNNTENWTTFSFEYKSRGKEEYFTIGGPFESHTHPIEIKRENGSFNFAYYHLDDLSIVLSE